MSRNALSLLCFITITFSSGFSSSFDYFENEANHSDFDVLIFTQQWPPTTCYHFMEENKNNVCNLPAKNELWTIHGIWPTKFGHIGPSFCNKSSPFDIQKLEPIEDDLKMYWPSIESKHSVDVLWKHEWLKHGTCASSISEMSDEEKYFKKGLEWRQNFLIAKILANANILPDSQTTVINIQNAFKKYLNKNPSIHCLYDQHKDASFLSDIRLCFNKTLNLIDCDGVFASQIAIDYPGGKVITNCHISKPVQYPSIVPPLKEGWKFPFVNLYKLLNFIMWFTL